MGDEIRAAAERLRGIEGPTFHGIGGKRHISEREYADAVTLARAWLAEHPVAPSPAPTPAGPSPAAGKAGERCEGCWTHGAVELVRIQVPNGVLTLCRQCLDAVNRKNPALLALGPRLAALEAALRMIDLDDRETVYALGTDFIDAARAALGAAGPGGE